MEVVSLLIALGWHAHICYLNYFYLHYCCNTVSSSILSSIDTPIWFLWLPLLSMHDDFAYLIAAFPDTLTYPNHVKLVCVCVCLKFLSIPSVFTESYFLGLSSSLRLPYYVSALPVKFEIFVGWDALFPINLMPPSTHFTLFFIFIIVRFAFQLCPSRPRKRLAANIFSKESSLFCLARCNQDFKLGRLRISEPSDYSRFRLPRDQIYIHLVRAPFFTVMVLKV